jgi:hypothetical protein
MNMQDTAFLAVSRKALTLSPAHSGQNNLTRFGPSYT